MSGESTRRLLVTDLDNTLWDWFQAWYESFSVLLSQVAAMSGVKQQQLEEEIQSIHQLRRTAEYSNLLNEMPSLVELAAPEQPSSFFAEALHAFRSRRKASTNLYPGVQSTLLELKSRGVRIAAYTESGAFWTGWRIRNTGLDGIIDVLYSAADHALPQGMVVEDLRTGHNPPDSYQFKSTLHHNTPIGEIKPSAAILESILSDQHCTSREAVYIGDSLMKDIAMAQSVGVLDVHAKYGEAQAKPEYELLRRVTHWSAEDVERERSLSLNAGRVVPTLTCAQGFAEVLQAFDR